MNVLSLGIRIPVFADMVNHKRDNVVQKLKRITGKETPPRSNKYRRQQFACNDSLAEMIRVANLLPNGFRFDLAAAHRYPYDDWFETFKALPVELKHELFVSPEFDQFIREDSSEYWYNNDGKALDKLSDMHANEQITYEEYICLYSQDSYSIATFLVDRGYVGEEYSYRKQEERKAERERKRRREERDHDSEFSISDQIPFLSYMTSQFPYIQALLRIQHIYDFLDGITKLADSSEQMDQSGTELSESAIRQVLSETLSNQVVASKISITSSGDVHFSLSSWAEAIQDVRITRIRRCEVCQKFFWANRKDAFACSTPHAKLRYMRLMRKNWEVSGHLYKTQRKSKNNRKRNPSDSVQKREK